MINDIIYIAKTAGEIILDGFGKQFSVELKGNQKNLVTEIDKKSEYEIIKFISGKFPTHSILAEERGELIKSSDYLWVIDPLDGTTNFAHGLPIFSVSIGVLFKDELIAGVVYDVMKDFVYSAEKGSGAYENNKKIFVSRNESIDRSLLVTGFPYNVAENPEQAFERFIALTKKARAVRRLGSAAIDFCYVAKGVFDGFWEVYLNPWDIAAGKLLVEEAGGNVTDFSGNQISIFNKTILASNGIIHSELVKSLQIDN